MAVEQDRKIEMLLDRVDRYLDEVEAAARGARSQLSKGRVGDAMVGVAHAQEFSAKAGTTIRHLHAYIRKLESRR